MMSLTIASFPSDVRGTGSALALMMLDLGLIAGAPILGLIADAYGFNWMFVSISVFCLIVTGIYAFSSIPVWRERLQQRRNLEFPQSSVTARAAVDESAV